MDFELLIIFAMVAFAAGFVDAIVGGGGLITLPTLILGGLDPTSAVATNKFQATSGSFSALIEFSKNGLIPWREGKLIALCGFAFSVFGATIIHLINRQWFEIGVPFLLLGVAIYFSLSSTLSNSIHKERIHIHFYSLLVVPFLGFYDGIFGAGIGLFFMTSMILLCGFSLIKSMSFTKLAVAACNTGSLVVFICNDLIVWPIAIMMASISFIGAKAGAHYAIKKGGKLLKPLVILVSCAMAIKLLGNQETSLKLITMPAVENLQDGALSNESGSLN